MPRAQALLAADLLDGLVADHDEFGVLAAERLLAWASENAATDLHLVPAADDLPIAARINGRLQPVCVVPAGGARLIARLKVLAGLLTYRSDTAQEGRLPVGTDADGHEVPARLATFPTVHGEKAVVRLFGARRDYTELCGLGLPDSVLADWKRLLARPAGLLLISGPAGAGKTTTGYASLRYLLAESAQALSVVSLEDPVEQLVDGAAQTAVGANTGMSFADGLRAVLRHDPQVIFVGELRDSDTVTTAMRAALTGHLVIATTHAGSAAETVVRLFDAGVEPFVVLSGLTAVLHQRLVDGESGSKDRGEVEAVAELLTIEDEGVREAVRQRVPSADLEAAAIGAGMVPVSRVGSGG